ncbi:hypothetical protein [Saccharothrix australiensis]|uniref:Uncharacterized protein n=1 Tax=Saccharothrix australiensis TaxID=2072 RepID=A0A495VZE2_9PSEU|nr:hypothetical protein [Saccharothrix australiensis]RKT54812.1 hypothetical protein C8E97_3461 [Saccharothrix australiensis]
MTTGEVVNPVADVPLVGGLLAVLDEFAAGLGVPFWLRALAECALVAVVGFAVLRLVATRVLPWVGEALVRPVVLVTAAVRALLLLVDLGISRAVRRFGRVPPEPVYAYGTAVMAVLDVVEGFVRAGLPKLAIARAAPRWLLVGAMVMAFLAWNGNECVPSADTACVSPVNHWTTSFEAWVGTR